MSTHLSIGLVSGKIGTLAILKIIHKQASKTVINTLENKIKTNNTNQYVLKYKIKLVYYSTRNLH